MGFGIPRATLQFRETPFRSIIYNSIRQADEEVERHKVPVRDFANVGTAKFGFSRAGLKFYPGIPSGAREELTLPCLLFSHLRIEIRGVRKLLHHHVAKVMKQRVLVNRILHFRYFGEVFQLKALHLKKAVATFQYYATPRNNPLPPTPSLANFYVSGARAFSTTRRFWPLSRATRLPWKKKERKGTRNRCRPHFPDTTRIACSISLSIS